MQMVTEFVETSAETRRGFMALKAGQNLYGGSSVKRLLAVHIRLSVAVERSPVHALLITVVAAERLDFGESVEIDNRLKRRRGGTVSKAIG
jgi:hypothetical protein